MVSKARRAKYRADLVATVRAGRLNTLEGYIDSCAFGQDLRDEGADVEAEGRAIAEEAGANEAETILLLDRLHDGAWWRRSPLVVPQF